MYPSLDLVTCVLPMRSGMMLGFLTVHSACFAVGFDDEPVNRAQETLWTIEAFAGFGQDYLGSEDVRRGGFYSVQYAMPWDRLRFRNTEGQLVVSGYYMFTKGAGYEGIPVDHLHTFGVTASARYWNHVIRGTETFFDFGWGLSYSNRKTIDLSGQLNSTPFIGIGMLVPGTDDRMVVTVRWFHMSNAGTQGNNQGLNQIQYGVGYRF